MNFDYIIDAAQINCVIRWLHVNRSLEEKDKLIDELLKRRLEKIRDDLFHKGINGVKFQQEGK